MPSSVDRTNMLLSGLLHMSDETEGSLHFRECSKISEAMLEHYANLVREGRPGQVIALAMLGATLNLYDLFGLKAELPTLFRTLADRIEGHAQPHWH